MVYVCPCRYPIIVLDKRDFDNEDTDKDEYAISYIAVPEGTKNLPLDIDIGQYNGDIEEFRGQKFVAVKWRNTGKDAVKEYEVNGHVVVAGCSSPIEMKNGELKCDEKDMYTVFHPTDDWLDDHVKYVR